MKKLFFIFIVLFIFVCNNIMAQNIDKRYESKIKYIEINGQLGLSRSENNKLIFLVPESEKLAMIVKVENDGEEFSIEFTWNDHYDVFFSKIYKNVSEDEEGNISDIFFVWNYKERFFETRMLSHVSESNSVKFHY